MNIHENSLNWFEIPVTDLQRAKHFYQVVFAIHMEESFLNDMHLAYFPTIPGNGKATGALVQGPGHIPSLEGTIVYLNAGQDLQQPLNRVETEGGKILSPKTLIGPQMGYMAFIEDTEGNRVALHSAD
jgi:predicted enzyme related to lactoylglutathione lyase